MKKRLQLLKVIGKLLLLIVLWAVTLVYALFQGGFVSWFLFYSFVPFALFSLMVSMYPLSNFEVERTFKSNDFKAGESMEVSLRIRRKFPFPLFYLVADDIVSPSIFYRSSFQKAKSIIYPGFRREIHLRYTIDELPRGEHHFSAVRLKTGDFLGIFEKETTVTSSNTLLVYPSFVDVVYRPMESRYDQGMTSSNVKIQKDTTMATGIKEYQPGDRFSWIHWKSFARTNELMTKEFEERQSHDVLVVLDRESSQAFEPMVTFAASILKAILRKGAQAGLLSIGEDHVSFPIRGGEEHQRQLYHHLAKVKADGKYDLSKVLEGEGINYQQSAAVMFITSSISKKLISTVRSYAKRNSSVVIFLIKEKGAYLTDEEKALKAMAAGRGIWLKVSYEGEFDSAFSEVKNA
ncbi:DUF58 domain-containing protein [Rossellomorea vietnamensis]|uniref:DUF58 domain-containing protein n=1 Tax=Rossellomorea vietnamensis TaxID=218284 RepID=A0A5D4K7R1_9BACI|nr:DUF58 domain-containing protein [Rossellomorea vietnamensis]TYR72785.1 DUF58 domain-containing protein [Rossellomorea vietnamensis]